MKIKLGSAFFAAFCCLASCKNNTGNVVSDQTPVSVNQLEKTSWLLGKWGNSNQGVAVTEIWIKENDSVYTGISYSIRTTNDTISSERIRLEKQGDKLVYIPVVKDQNKDEIVKFTLTSSNEQELVFENPDHDFPQKISYKLINNDSLLAEIAGVYKGKQQAEQFPMRRIK